MKRLWAWLRSLTAPPHPVPPPPDYDDDRDSMVRWLRMQRHKSERSQRHMQRTGNIAADTIIPPKRRDS